MLYTTYMSVCQILEIRERNGPPVLTAVALKQGLQDGISEPRSRWESPKVQRTVSGSREGRSRMKMRQGSRMREEVSIVALRWD